MGTFRAWLGLELRRRGRSLVVLTLLIAVSTGTVLTAVAGARRSDSAIDRLRAASHPADVRISQERSHFDWSKVRALPQVESLSLIAGTGFGVDGLPFFPLVAPNAYDGAAMYDVERPVVLAGRLPDPNRVDEAVVTPRFLELNHHVLGDTVTARLNRPEVLDQAFTLTNIPEPDGRAVPMRIVGVIRSNWFSDTTADAGLLVPSPALFARHRAELIGAHDTFPLGALITLHGGRSEIPAFQRALGQVPGGAGIDVNDLAELARQPARADTFQAGCLLGFGVVALIAALVLVGQAVARHAGAGVPELRILGTLGMTPRQRVLAAIAGPGLAGVIGTSLGVGAAVLASAWMPFGAAALVEPHPGISLDLPVLAGGSLLAVAGVCLAAAAAAWSALSFGDRPPPARRSALGSLVAVSVPVTVGVRFALEAGRDRIAVPVRPAVIGAVFGVLGVLTAVTFAAAVADADRNPERFGLSHQLEFTVGYSGQDFLPAQRMLTALASDPAVAGTNDSKMSIVEAAGIRLPAYVHQPVGTPLPAVMQSGRMPSAEDEVVLAPASARALKAGQGDHVVLTGPTGSAQYRVSGIGFVPTGWENAYDTGAWLTAAGQARVTDTFKFHQAMIALRPGTALADVRPRLAAVAGSAVGKGPITMNLPPRAPQIAQLRQVRLLPVFLGVFLVVLGVGAVGHALTTTVRRRRVELAVLRALGMTRRQARGVVLTQAGVLAAIGLGVGMPLGVALGRTLWRMVADYLPVQFEPPAVTDQALLTVPLALVLVGLLAAWPARQAARLRVAQVLRAE
jgi:hypothetical protein